MTKTYDVLDSEKFWVYDTYLFYNDPDLEKRLFRPGDTIRFHGFSYCVLHHEEIVLNCGKLKPFGNKAIITNHNRYYVSYGVPSKVPYDSRQFDEDDDEEQIYLVKMDHDDEFEIMKEDNG